MSLNTGLQLAFGVQPLNPVPVDVWSGPYEDIILQDAIDQANIAIPVAVRFKSMEVRLIVNGVTKKYWYRDGVSNTDLIEFFEPTFYIIGGSTYSYNTTDSIYRTGGLSIGTGSMTTETSTKLHIYSTQSGAFRLEDGTQEDNYILSSNSQGVASWTSSSFITTPISGSYSVLVDLVNSNSLELGRKYILTDYLHKYQVLGSDSGAVTQYHTMIGQLYGQYITFNNVPISTSTGALVTATWVPPGATITVGSTFTVSSVFSTQYIILSPTTAANNANFGTIFAFQKQRYPNVPTDSIIYDDYGNIVMKKGGVINTDVHNGLPYMSMTASQNTAVQVEQLVLTAISDNQFSINAESLTYTGDLVEYLFDNSDILDEDGNTLSVNRNGFIISRKNSDLDISMNKDWRSQRYRRYKIDTTNWSELTLSGASNSTLYTIGGYNYGGVLNTSLDDGHKYLLRFPYEADVYLDFYSNTNTDPFKNGELSSPNINASYRLNIDTSNTYIKSIATNGLTYSNLKLAFDYTIIPMNGYEPKTINNKIQITNIENTIFKDLNRSNGISRDYSINIENIYDSTIGTGADITSTNKIYELKSIDDFDIINTGYINNLLITYTGVITNSSTIVNCRFSGFTPPTTGTYLSARFSNSYIYNTIIGLGRIDNLLISDSMINRSMFLFKQLTTSRITGNLYLTSINSPVVTHSSIFNFNNFNVYRQISSTQSKGLFGVKHTISSDMNNIQVDNYNPKLELVSKVLDINYGSLTYNIIGVTE
jgi:hypothetical protein